MSRVRVRESCGIECVVSRKYDRSSSSFGGGGSAVKIDGCDLVTELNGGSGS